MYMYNKQSDDVCKPDLLIHPNFLRYLEADCVRAARALRHFNLLEHEDATVRYREQARVILVDSASRALRTSDVMLEPHYDQRIGTGVEACVTSYYLHRSTRMYRVRRRFTPRYVIWDAGSPTDVCATYLDRTDVYEFGQAVDRAVEWAAGLRSADIRVENLAVFDLDRTLIDDDGQKLRRADELVRCARERFDKVVLWSHGSNLHVDEHALLFGDGAFDLRLSDASAHGEARSAKNMLSIYNYFPQSRFARAILVDDSLFNWTPEYSRMYVPVYPLDDLTALIRAMKQDYK